MAQQFADKDDLTALLAAGWPLSADTVAQNDVPHVADATAPKRRQRSTLDNPQGEDLMQMALLGHCRNQFERLPAFRYLYHNPNGGGRSSEQEAIMLQRMGTLAGVLDLTWPLPRGGYHGLYGELKVKRNRPTPDQEAFAEFVAGQGYIVFIWWDDWRLAYDDLEAYEAGRFVVPLLNPMPTIIRRKP